MRRDAGVAVAAREYKRDIGGRQAFRDGINGDISDIDVEDRDIGPVPAEVIYGIPHARDVERVAEAQLSELTCRTCGTLLGTLAEFRRLISLRAIRSGLFISGC